jgi:hypothetical protein
LCCKCTGKSTERAHGAGLHLMNEFISLAAQPVRLDILSAAAPLCESITTAGASREAELALVQVTGGHGPLDLASPGGTVLTFGTCPLACRLCRTVGRKSARL